jgi:hypothetical protein
MKKLLIQAFERHLASLLALGWVRLPIFEIFKSLAMRSVWVLTFRKCQVKGVQVFEKVRLGEHIFIYPVYTWLKLRAKRNICPHTGLFQCWAIF